MEQQPQQPQNGILTALIAKFEAERMEAIALLNLYMNQPAAVADHTNIIGEAAKLVQRISSAEGSLRTLQQAKPGDPAPTA